MDIRQPLSTLRNLLHERLNIDLSDYEFWLQDAQMVNRKETLNYFLFRFNITFILFSIYMYIYIFIA